MANETFKEANPAFVALCHQRGDGAWHGEVLDLPGCEASGQIGELRKDDDAFAVIYQPTDDGAWLATVVDVPECTARAASVHAAKMAISQKLRRIVDSHGSEAPEAAPRTLCHYIRPAHLTNGASEALLVNALTVAVTKLVEAGRSANGVTPRATTVCGYVRPSSKTPSASSPVKTSARP